MAQYRFSVIVEKYEDGYVASCNELKECFTQGDSYEVVLANIKNSISMHVKNRLFTGEEIPQPDNVSVTILDVSVD